MYVSSHVRERADDDIRAFRLEAFASLICFMHKGGDGKAFVKELKSNGHARFSGDCQNKDSWFIHRMELLFDKWRDATVLGEMRSKATSMTHKRF
jgi:hypothetical protein